MGLLQDFIVAVRVSAKLARRDTDRTVEAAQDALFDRTARALTVWAPHLNTRRIFNQLNEHCASFRPESASPLGDYIDIGEDISDV